MSRVLILIAAIVFAIAASSQELSVVSGKVDKKNRGWGSRSISIDHYSTTQEEDYDYSTLTFDASYKFNRSHRLQMVQGITKKYNIPIDTNEFDASDTRIYHHYTFAKKWNGIGFALRSGLTLPLSSQSIDHDKITKASLRLTMSRSFFKDRLSLSYRPNASYYVNEYKQSLGGYPLPQWGIGNSFLAVYRPFDRVTLVGAAAFGSLFMSQTKYRQSDEPINGTYSFDFYGVYSVVKERMDLRAGYSQGKSLITSGRYEVYLFDERSTQLYLGLDYYL